MKRKINRVVSKIALAIIIAGLAVALPLPRLNARSSASAHTANKPSDAPSALQGDGAIRNLKERGIYNSLREAVATARFKTIVSTFTEQDKLTADDGMVFDFFGRSVAIYGDTAMVGAPSDDNGSNKNQGSAYVFARSGASWIEQKKLTASLGETGDWFGYSVAISLLPGTIQIAVMVGAPYADMRSITGPGLAYMFSADINGNF